MAITLLNRKESVILTAIEIIDGRGIQGLSTREIARRQGISEGTLFRHFRTKNDIILAVLDYFSQYDSDIFHSVELKGLPAREAILFFVDSYVTYYENYPAITAMTQIFDVLSRESDFAAKVSGILADRLNFLRRTISAGQKTGEISPAVDSEALADMITGTCTAICLRWRMNNCGFALREKTLSALRMILKAFGPQGAKEEGE
ncbi:MAG: TetR/AcrR family transcriptional regulator [Negativicutes bacterium]|nr:TetR/AcrR family transcriptional regulator [Negativicutes bacterium]